MPRRAILGHRRATSKRLGARSEPEASVASEPRHDRGHANATESSPKRPRERRESSLSCGAARCPQCNRAKETPMKRTELLSGSILTLALLLASAPIAAAADCALTYTRTACKGHEAESYAKCDGKQTCTKDVEAASETACQEAAVKACANDRLTITESKVINATFKGKALKSSTGNDDFCID